MANFAPSRWEGSGKRSVQARRPGNAPPPAHETPPETPNTEPTDAAKALAGAHGIDLALVTGTGADGRVTKDDVQAVIDARTEPEPEPTPEPAAEPTLLTP